MRVRYFLALAVLLLPAWAHAQIDPTGSISTAGSDCSTATNCVGWSTDDPDFATFGVYLNVATSGTFVFEASQNATTASNGTWVSVENNAGDASVTADGANYFANTGYRWFRVRASAISGAATISVARGFGGGGSGSSGGVAGTVAISQTADENLVDVGTVTGTVQVQSNTENIATETTLSAVSATLTTIATALQPEDSAHVSDDPGFPMLCVQRASTTPAATAGTAGDYAVPNCDVNGRLIVNTTLYSSAGVELTSTEVTEDAPETAGITGPMVLSVRRDAAVSSAGTAGDNATFNTDGLGRLWVRNGDPCADPARITHAAISESTAATNEIVALNGSDLIYVCSYKWVTTAANSLSWTRGTGSDCGTGTTAIEGAQPYAANGGATEQGGGHALFVVPAGNALCLVSSAATAHGGRVSYVRTAAP